MAGAQARRVALYFLDWDREARSQTVDILDASSGAVLDSRSISDFAQGKYVVWNLSGHVRIRVTRTTGPNAVVNGLFFGDGIHNNTGNATASFVGTDAATQGNWKGV